MEVLAWAFFIFYEAPLGRAESPLYASEAACLVEYEKQVRVYMETETPIRALTCFSREVNQ